MTYEEALEVVREMQRRNEQLGAWPTGGAECQAAVNKRNGEALKIVLDLAERFIEYP